MDPSSEHPWVDLTTLLQVTTVVLQDVLPNHVPSIALVLGFVRLSDHVLPAKAVARHEDVSLAAGASLVLADLRHWAIGGVVYRLFNVILASHDSVLVVDVGLAELVVPAWSLL